jgi:hypothetical protein
MEWLPRRRAPATGRQGISTSPQESSMATFGVIVGNRGFFPSHLAESGRRDILAVLE